jgi:hypothetical protein
MSAITKNGKIVAADLTCRVGVRVEVAEMVD